MGLALAFAILLLIFGGVVADVIFAAKRWGWPNVLRYLFFGICGRVLTHFTLSERDQTAQTFVPLIGAGLLVWLLPHVMRQRALENDGKLDADTNDDATTAL